MSSYVLCLAGTQGCYGQASSFLGVVAEQLAGSVADESRHLADTWECFSARSTSAKIIRSREHGILEHT